MSPSTTLQRHPAAIAAFVMTILSFANNSMSFPTSPILPASSHSSTFLSITKPLPLLPSSRTKTSSLHMAVQSPMRPMEEERDHEKSEDDRPDREWKQVVGGFVPKFLRRSSTTTEQPPQPRLPIQTVDTLPSYKHHVVDEKHRLVVVRFYAPWCKSCKASEPLFHKLVRDHSPAVKFVEVPLTKETAYLHEGLGVPSVPYAHVYHPEGGLVEERKANKKVFGELREAVESYVRGCCYLDWEDEVVVMQPNEEEDGFQ